ncbi:MAG: DUF2834 domain-containing protein [Cyanobacteria bacterium J06621_12]
MRKVFFGLLWLTLIIYVTFFPNTFSATQQSDFDLIIRMSTLQLSGINPILIAIFYTMGIFPIIYAALILFDNSETQVSPYPFLIVSFGLGAYALLPYFALRESNSAWLGQKNLLQKILDSSLLAIACSVTVVVFWIWGSTQGNWSDFWMQWQSSKFAHVMTIDFCLLSLLFMAILGDDMQRRGVNSAALKVISFVPLLGALVYWCFRPQLPVSVNSQQLTANS